MRQQRPQECTDSRERPSRDAFKVDDESELFTICEQLKLNAEIGCFTQLLSRLFDTSQRDSSEEKRARLSKNG